MSHAIGMRSYLGIGFQSAHGVVADVLSAHWLPFVSESLVENVPRIDSGEIRTTFDEGYSHQGLRTTAGDITLEPTYTAKTFAAFLAVARSNTDKGPLLFWNTFSSVDLSALAETVPISDLPRPFQRCF